MKFFQNRSVNDCPFVCCSSHCIVITSYSIHYTKLYDAGLTPAFVCATVGTTSSTAVDPLERIAAVARRFGAWLHVDAAMAGSAMICPEFRPLQAGVERADSYCFDPHKWLFTNFSYNFV